jgi:hypothetical protein
LNIILASCVALLSGCAASITTPDVTLDLQPAKETYVGLERAKLTAKTRQCCWQRHDVFGTTLLGESNGRVGARGDQPLILSASAELKSSIYDNDQSNAMLGGVSLIIFPLALVPSTDDASFTASYEVRDRTKSLLYKNYLEGKIEGSAMGYFVARIHAIRDLVAMEAEYAARNAARLILQDLDRHSEKLLLAVGDQQQFRDDARALLAQETQRNEVEERSRRERRDRTEIQREQEAQENRQQVLALVGGAATALQGQQLARAGQRSGDQAMVNQGTQMMQNGLAAAISGDPSMLLVNQSAATGIAARSAQGSSDGATAEQIGASCKVTCGNEESSCNGGSMSGCYRAAACMCQCFLNSAPSNPNAGQWRQCVAKNTANANALKSSAPTFSFGRSQPRTTYAPPPPPLERPRCPGPGACAGAAR